jgi:hypothetical protein
MANLVPQILDNHGNLLADEITVAVYLGNPAPLRLLPDGECEDPSYQYTGERAADGRWHGRGELNSPLGTYQGMFSWGFIQGHGEYFHNDGERVFRGHFDVGHPKKGVAWDVGGIVYEVPKISRSLRDSRGRVDEERFWNDKLEWRILQVRIGRG